MQTSVASLPFRYRNVTEQRQSSCTCIADIQDMKKFAVSAALLAIHGQASYESAPPPSDTCKPTDQASICSGLPMEGAVVSFCNLSSFCRQQPQLQPQQKEQANPDNDAPVRSCDPPSHRASSSGASMDSDSTLQQQLHTIDGVHAVFGSSLLRARTAPDVPNPKVVAAVAGTGLAPWEIHRPQRFVRDLVLRRCFSGRVLDAGCGIGDNALYIAKACPQAQVTAVDVVSRCLDFAGTKAGLRGIRSKVTLLMGDLRDYDSLPTELKAEPFDVVLDSFTFHGFSDESRDMYVGTLRLLLRPGGVIYMNCMSEEETRPGGPRRISIREAQGVFNREHGWEVESIEDSIIELHPTFWTGKAKARVYIIRRLL